VCTFLAPLVAAEGVVAEDIMYVVTASARCVGRVDGQSEFAAETEKEGQWREAILEWAS
jgi:adenosine/AMP kinase